VRSARSVDLEGSSSQGMLSINYEPYLPDINNYMVMKEPDTADYSTEHSSLIVQDVYSWVCFELL
jgi:hypothetical protein